MNKMGWSVYTELLAEKGVYPLVVHEQNSPPKVNILTSTIIVEKNEIY